MENDFEGYMIFIQLPGSKPNQFQLTEQVFLDGHCEGVPSEIATEWKAEILKEHMPTTKVFVRRYKFTAVKEPISSEDCDHPINQRHCGESNDWCKKCGYFPIPKNSGEK